MSSPDVANQTRVTLLGGRWARGRGRRVCPTLGGCGLEAMELWSCHLLTEQLGHRGHLLGIPTGSVGAP